MTFNLNRQTWSPHDTATTSEQRAAALYVASIATDTDDAARLLAALGLLPRTHPAVMQPDDHGMRGYRLGCRCQTCRKAKADQTTPSTTADTTTGSAR